MELCWRQAFKFKERKSRETIAVFTKTQNKDAFVRNVSSWIN